MASSSSHGFNPLDMIQTGIWHEADDAKQPDDLLIIPTFDGEHWDREGAGAAGDHPALCLPRIRRAARTAPPGRTSERRSTTPPVWWQGRDASRQRFDVRFGLRHIPLIFGEFFNSLSDTTMSVLPFGWAFLDMSVLLSDGCSAHTSR
ncbi:hypothetical protein [Bradyrhizobium elkanii]|uniref:hypothetical protein n=1 Tax=Bradyrhizobium elkanii TaxID=29448 RepID=UPI001BA6B792|nr:hypothetical protein [Bradyrhizobium elkanii]MBR1164622.1 hypothetical protein [Bradyrhizobium elkanii]